MRKSIVALISAGLGFVVAVVAIQRIVAWEPYVAGYSDKLAWWEEQKEDLDVLFLGSSRIFRHIVPEVFDAAATAEGLPVRSMNFGVDALSLIELLTLAESIAQSESGRPRYVLIEPTFVTNMPLRNMATQRSVYFHDLQKTLLEIQVNRTIPRYRNTVGRNALASVYHYGNLGRLSWALFDHRTETPDERVVSSLREARGFIAQDDNPPEGQQAWHQDLLDNIGEYTREMQADKPYPQQVAARYVEPSTAMVELASYLEARGIEVIYLTTPGFYGVEGQMNFEVYLTRNAPDINVMSYITGFKEIYVPRYWYDSGHMSGEGARLFSERLGRDFAQQFGSGEDR